MSSTPRFQHFEEFYPYYLEEHSNRANRRLHFVGTSIGLALFLIAVFTLNPWWILAALVTGYGFAWVGHFFFEHNRPATFKYPWMSYRGDWRMWREMLTGRIPF